VAAEKEVKNSLMFGTGYARIKNDFEKVNAVMAHSSRIYS
jgi:hypothetical protein